MVLYKVSNGELVTNLRFIVEDSNHKVVMVSAFDRSKSTIKGFGAGIKAKGNERRIGYSVITNSPDLTKRSESRVLSGYMEKDDEYDVYYTNFLFDHDRAAVCEALHSEIGKKYIVTKYDWMEDDIYNGLLNGYNLPILKEWLPYIKNALESKSLISQLSYIYAMEEATIRMRGENVALSELVLVTFQFTEEDLSYILSEGLKTGAIKICEKKQAPLNLGESGKSLDTYMLNYGKDLQTNVDKQIHPLIPLMDKVEGFVTKATRPYPQQAAAVNGMIALMHAGEKYGFYNCGMGVGKTLMSIGAVEGYFNTKWLAEHPGKSLKDMYLSKDQPVYRVVIMPPGHMVEKWKREIEKEVPGAEVEILTDLSQLDYLRRRGKKPSGREWYVISKDFCKLGSYDAPIPTSIGSSYIMAPYCKTCQSEDDKIVYVEKTRKNRSICPKCGETKKIGYLPLTEYGKHAGLICPSCNRLLANPERLMGKTVSGDHDDEVIRAEKCVLQPCDFAAKKSTNDFCYYCGTPLWGINCKPVGSYPKSPNWYKITHFSNWSLKNRKSAWVLKGKENSYYNSASLIDPMTDKLYEKLDIQKSKGGLFSPRKVAPARYIRKYLKGFFDFLILDEAHKYAGAGTAQMQAAHALVKSSKFTMALTGTLTNGKADSLFYLLWMLDSRLMVSKGFTFNSVLSFSESYGCVETVFEALPSNDRYHVMSKGRQINAPRTKPGISPLVYSEFLLGHAINMDLSDLSKYLPPLIEKVELLDLPTDVQRAYSRCTNTLKEEARKKEGGCLLGEMLNFCLSYPDKPYGRKPIMHPRLRDYVVLNPPSCDEYLSGKLLPKEERIVSIIKSEIAEGRNVFVFANFTGKEETNVTTRLKSVIERECALSGRVEILRADSPEALKREAYIHERAKAGAQVVITNAKVCETGLDFCFEEDGVFYNYPTIVFAQPTYELATMMQASRRHYRLCQTEECRTYWMAYNNTLQSAALQIMASKQVAASAIQGKFSAEGLAAMAQGVDPRIALAQKLARDDTSSREELVNMFDVLAKSNHDSNEQEDSSYEKPLLYIELMGPDYVDDVTSGRFLDMFNFMPSFSAFSKNTDEINVKAAEIIPLPLPVQEESKKEDNEVPQQTLFSASMRIFEDRTIIPFEPAKKLSGRKKTLKMAAGQLSFFE